MNTFKIIGLIILTLAALAGAAVVISALVIAAHGQTTQVIPLEKSDAEWAQRSYHAMVEDDS